MKRMLSVLLVLVMCSSIMLSLTACSMKEAAADLIAILCIVFDIDINENPDPEPTPTADPTSKPVPTQMPAPVPECSECGGNGYVVCPDCEGYPDCPLCENGILDDEAIEKIVQEKMNELGENGYSKYVEDTTRISAKYCENCTDGLICTQCDNGFIPCNACNGN